MEISSIVGIIGGIAGIVSIIMVIYGLGVRFGGIKERVSALEERLIEPKEFGELKSKVDFIYDIIVADIIARGRSNPESHSSKNKEIELPEEVVAIVNRKVLENLDKFDFEIVSEILKELGTLDRNLRNHILHEAPPQELISAIYEKVKKIKKEYQEQKK